MTYLSFYVLKLNTQILACILPIENPKVTKNTNNIIDYCNTALSIGNYCK